MALLGGTGGNRRVSQRLRGIRGVETVTRNQLRFVELAALGRNAWWLYLLSLGMIVATAYLIAQFGVWALLNVGQVEAIALIFEAPSVQADAPLDQRIMVFAARMWPFVSFLVAMIVIVPLVHGRSWRTLIHRPQGFNWPAFFTSTFFAVLLPLSAIAALVWETGETFPVQFDPFVFIVFGAAILALIPLQVLAEEMFFRGYMMQGLAHFTESTLVRLLIPAAVFAALHFGNREVIEGGIGVMGFYFLLAIYLGILALVGNGLEYSIGMHLGQNLYVALLVSPIDSSRDRPSIIRTEAEVIGPFVVLGTALLYVIHFALTFSSAAIINWSRRR